MQTTTFLEKYGKYLRQNVARIDPKIWIIGSVLVSVTIASLVFMLIFFKIANVSMIFPFVTLFMALDLLIGYPYIKEMNRIEEIETALPDALKQMADTLKSGGTYEYALREISTSDYGPLTKEVDNVLRKLEEGGNFENSMKSLSENVDSRLVQRSVTILVDSIKAGAGLADALEEIADDIRELHHIKVERKTRTMMGFLFILFAGAIVAPAIFGLVSTIINFLIETVSSSGIANTVEITKAIGIKDSLLLLMQIYIFIEVLATSMIVSLMREGKINKSFIYAPILLFLAYIAMTIAAAASQMILKVV
jgi:flagellar protein FlaJ